MRTGCHSSRLIRPPCSTVGWCWLRTSVPGQNMLFWQLLAGKAWEILSYIVTPVLYILVRVHMARGTLPAGDSEAAQLITRKGAQAAHKADAKLLFVPLVFILIRIWGTTRFFLHVLDPENDQAPNLYPLAVLQVSRGQRCLPLPSPPRHAGSGILPCCPRLCGGVAGVWRLRPGVRQRPVVCDWHSPGAAALRRCALLPVSPAGVERAFH